MSASLYSMPGQVPGFTVLELTTALNKVPLVPSLVGSLNLFAAKPMSITNATIEQRDNRLALVPEQPRGAPANRNVMGQRTLLTMPIPHFPLSDTVMADAIQNVRGFGTMQADPWWDAVNDRLQAMAWHHDATLEHLRLGAIRGTIITVVDRETGAPLRVIDLFAQFGVVPPEPVDFEMRGPNAQTPAAQWNSKVMTASRLVARRITAELGGAAGGIAAICGAEFYDALLQSAELRSTYLATAQAPVLREARLFTPIVYGGISFYDGGMEAVGGLPFIKPDEAHFIPLGVPDLFVEAYAPAPYIETVNTAALPRYAKQEILDFDKGVEIETQQNVLPLCTRPRVLLTGRLVDAP